MSVKICMVALSAYPLLSGSDSKRVIGPSIHTVLLARELIKNSFDVTLITYDGGGPPVEYIDGIKVIKVYRENARLTPASKAFRIWRAMRKAKADIYYHHGGASGVVPFFCRLTQKKSVWHIAHDYYVLKGLKNFNPLARSGAWLDIKLADVIVAQSEFQRVMLKENFGRDSSVIKNHFPLTRRGIPEKAIPPVALWVGAMAETKDPELFLKVAEGMPEAQFQMIGGISTPPELYERVKEESSKILNLQYLDVVPFDEINKYYSRAAILVNTARGEGFPYAFIQAWMNYTPVVSLHSDPDEIIGRHQLGFHSGSFDKMVADIRVLLEDEPLRRRMGENSRRYVEENHDINSITRQYIEVFDRLVKS